MTSHEPKTRFIIIPYSMAFVSHFKETLELLLCFEKLLIGSSSQAESLSCAASTGISIGGVRLQKAPTAMVFY